MNESKFHTELKQLVTEAAQNDLTIEGGFTARTPDSDTPDYDVVFTSLDDQPPDWMTEASDDEQNIDTPR